ncbi:serine hydrolase [Macrococcus lamae]|nr:serine hydrolase [Macrococcus lamae]
MHLFFEENKTKAVILADDNKVLYSDYQADMQFPSASLIKLPIMLYIYTFLYDELDRSLQLDTRIEGCGPSPYLSVNEYCIRDLVTLMIISSDNTATNTLIKYIGMNQLNHYFMENNWSYTVLNRKMMDTERRLSGFDNMTSANDMMSILKMITAHEHFEEMFNIMKHQQLKEKIRLYIDDSAVEIGTKSGEFDHVRHEVGIIRSNDKVLLFVCMTDHPDSIKIHQAFHSFGLMLVDIITGSQSLDSLLRK